MTLPSPSLSARATFCLLCFAAAMLVPSVLSAHAEEDIGLSAVQSCMRVERPQSLQDLRCCLHVSPALDACLAHGLDDLGMDTPALLASLDRLQRDDTVFNELCHEVAHAIGRHALTSSPSFVQAFHSCNPLCQSGCYHGTIEAVFATPAERESGRGHFALSEIAERIPQLCAKEVAGQHLPKGLRLQCNHGVGHAILFTVDYRLDDALKGCDVLTDDDDRTNCLLGVFMENTTATDREKRNLKADDPLYPCNAVAEHYRSACYADQTRAMFHIGLRAEQIAKLCRQAGDFQSDCLRSLGRDLLGVIEPTSLRAAARRCEELAAPFAHDCAESAVFSLVDYKLRGAEAFAYCGGLQDSHVRKECFRSANTYLSSLYGKDEESLSGECETLTESDHELCLATLPSRPTDPLGIILMRIWRALRAILP